MARGRGYPGLHRLCAPPCRARARGIVSVKVLLDTCVWGGSRKALEDAGHEVASIPELGNDPGDAAVMALAHREGRVLITIDKDFGELAIVRRLPHSGILRLVDIAARSQGLAANAALERYGTELQDGAIVTVEPGRIRIRPPGD